MMTVNFNLSGLVVPKARPRFAGHSYLPGNYRTWKQGAILELTQQARHQGLVLPIPCPVSIDIHYSGHARGDSDNLSGSILDALTGAKVLADDSVIHVPRLCFVFEKAPANRAGTVIYLLLHECKQPLTKS